MDDQKINLTNFKNLTSEIIIIINLIQEIANEVGIEEIAMVGGIVRDSLINTSNKRSQLPLKDIDIVVQGSASILTDAINSKIGNKIKRIQKYKPYDTAEIEIDTLLIDITSARDEKYPILGGAPDVSYSDIKTDIKRRDFTINAMAIDLNRMRLIDPYNGQIDIRNRELKFLHHRSVADDPTRIIRAGRYSSRLNFNLDSNAKNQIKSTIKTWPWKWHQENVIKDIPQSLSTRLRAEIKLLFSELHWEEALSNIRDCDGLLLLDTSLQSDFNINRRIKLAHELKIDPLTALISGSINPIRLSERLQINQTQKKIINCALNLKDSIEKMNIVDEVMAWSPSRWSSEIEQRNYPHDAIGLLICNQVWFYKPLIKWYKKWRFIKSPISSETLLSQGWESGPKLGNELKRLRYEILDSE